MGKAIAILVGLITIVTFLVGRDTLFEVISKGRVTPGQLRAEIRMFESEYGSIDSLVDEIRSKEDDIAWIDERIIELRAERASLPGQYPGQENRERLREERRYIEEEVNERRRDKLIETRRLKKLKKDLSEWTYARKKLGID